MTRCPFVRAVQTGDLTTARALSLADGQDCEPAVFDMLVQWARDPGTVLLAGAHTLDGITSAG